MIILKSERGGYERNGMEDKDIEHTSARAVLTNTKIHQDETGR